MIAKDPRKKTAEFCEGLRIDSIIMVNSHRDIWDNGSSPVHEVTKNVFLDSWAFIVTYVPYD